MKNRLRLSDVHLLGVSVALPRADGFLRGQFGRAAFRFTVVLLAGRNLLVAVGAECDDSDGSGVIPLAAGSDWSSAVAAVA